MSCFTPRRSDYHQMFNRMTGQPPRFSKDEIQDLRKKFDKVAAGDQEIVLQQFKRNLGILGLHSAQDFAARLFNSFDIDSDGKISFQDFIEYMEVLKCGSERNKARISFKLIAPKDANKILISDFKGFLNDFFLSWSSITNIDITPQIRDRTEQYVNYIFRKVKQETGKAEITCYYYMDILYMDKDYMESFEFITQGMANIFINDRLSQSENDASSVLLKVLRELHYINDTVLAMTNKESYCFRPVMEEEAPKRLPKFVPFKVKNRQENSLHNSFSFIDEHTGEAAFKFKKKNNENGVKNINDPKAEDKGKKSKRKSIFGDANSRNGVTTMQASEQSGEPSVADEIKARCNIKDSNKQMLQKRLEFVRERVANILTETRTIYSTLLQKQEKVNERMAKTKIETVHNVHKGIKTSEGQMIFFGDDNWNLVLNMMIGIQMAVRSVRGFQEMIYEEPKDFNLKYYFELIPRRFGDEEYASTIYSFTDYAPQTFNHIRQAFGIDNQEYIGSIGPNRLMASLMMGEVSSMTSLTSQGKSGSFFYYTADGKYMLKTIKYREYSFLRSILKDYYQHVKQNPKTLITKFFGLHKLIQKSHTGSEESRSYFIIMANVFNTKDKIIERYDLKGSTYGRDAHDSGPTVTGKDNDFLRRGSKLYLYEQQREDLLQIISNDVKFFQAHDIIDYSLLVGVINKQERFDGDLYESRMKGEDFLRESRHFFSSQNREKYIFGIIDFLTLYDARKRFEYYFKSLLYGNTISAVPPQEYANRFKDFLAQQVFPLRPDSATTNQLLNHY